MTVGDPKIKPELKGYGLHLAPPTAKDLDRIVQAGRSEQLEKWLPWAGKNYTDQDADEFLAQTERNREKGCPIWGIYQARSGGNNAEAQGDSARGQLLGMVELTCTAPSTYELGFWVHPDSQGEGIATKAAALTVNAAFEAFAASRVEIFFDQDNSQSARVSRNLGFKPEGRKRTLQEDNQETDLIQSALLRTDWKGLPQEEELFLPPKAQVLNGRTPQDLVAEFHRVYQMPNLVAEGEQPTLDSPRLQMRMSLIAEEVTELCTAVYGQKAGQKLEEVFASLKDEKNRDLVETADALADLTYVIYGMALELGIDLEQVMAEVHSSNLSKLMEDGSVRRRDDGKILKGPNFREPQIGAILEALGQP